MAWKQITTCQQCNRRRLSKEDRQRGFRICEPCTNGRKIWDDNNDETEDGE
jgi:hypothetical protein